MKVIFLEDVPNVASAGEVKEAKDGYCRNYLLPRKLAVVATPAELKKLEARREAAARRQDRFNKEAENLAQSLEQLSINLKVRVGDEDRVYGSVTSADIAKEIKSVSGHDIDKRKIELAEPIRELGSHQVPVKLSKDVTASLNVVVERMQE